MFTVMERDGTGPRGSWRRTRALAVLLLLPGTAACGRAVTVDPPPAAATAACEALAAALPQTLRGEPRLAVTPDTGTTAAWGTPAIVWRCGVPRPTALAPTSQLVAVDGVDWFPELLSEGVRFTTVGRQPATELSVPAAHPNAAELLTELPTPG